MDYCIGDRSFRRARKLRFQTQMKMFLGDAHPFDKRMVVRKSHATTARKPNESPKQNNYSY